MTTALSEAISIAVTVHDGQVDKAGQPYILHPLRVMLAMGNDTDRIAAVLHDVVEDNRDWQLADLAGFGPDIVAAIDALTRREAEPYPDYIERLSGNEIAHRVKLADLRDNLDPSRLGIYTPADRLRVKKYEDAYRRLSIIGATA